MINVNKILQKNKWTGKEVGQLLIYSVLHDIKNYESKTEPFISQSVFNNMIKSLNTDKDINTYNIYSALYTGLVDSYNRGEALYQQFYNGFNSLLMDLREVQNTENFKKQLESLPLVVTETQYNRVKNNVIEKAKAYKVSYSQLVFELLQYILENEDHIDKVEVSQSIKEELENLKKVPAKNKKYIDLYNTTYGLGYYTLEDGTRSDSMTSEEWKEKLYNLRTKDYSLYIDGILASKEETIKQLNINRAVKLYDLFFKGAEYTRKAYKEKTGKELNGTDEDILKALEDLFNGFTSSSYFDEKNTKKQLQEAFVDNNKVKTTWHYNEETPEDLTQYELLDIYISEYISEIENKEKQKEIFKDLKKDYPTLYKALTAYIENNVEQAKGLKANQLYKDIISWGELAELNIGRYKELIEPSKIELVEAFKEENEDSTARYNKHHRGILNGIAILKNPSPDQIDEKGNYIETFEPLYSYSSLNKLEMNTDEVEVIQGYRDKLIYPALSGQYAINAMFSILSSIYDLPDLKTVASKDMTLFESKVTAYNNIIYTFYANVYAKGEELEDKRRQIKEFFPIIDLDYIKPNPEEIKKIKDEIEEIAFNKSIIHKLKYMDSWIDRLRVRGLYNGK